MARKAIRKLDPEELAQRRRRRVLLGCLGAVLLIIVVVAGGLLATYLRVRGGPALPRDVLRRDAQQRAAGSGPGAGAAPGAAAGTPAATAAVPAGTPSVKDQLERVAAAGAAGSTAPQTVYIPDSELAAAVTKGVGNNLRDARAYFGEGQAFVVGIVNFKGHDYNLTIAAEPVLVNGAVQFGVRSVKLGSMPAPTAVRDRVQQELNKHGGFLIPSRTGLYAEGIEIRNGVAVLRGRAVPKGQ